jgi:hypothetical protein
MSPDIKARMRFSIIAQSHQHDASTFFNIENENAFFDELSIDLTSQLNQQAAILLPAARVSLRKHPIWISFDGKRLQVPDA